LRFGAGQEHAEGQHVLEARIVDPFALIDKNAVHQRDLPGRAAEAEAADLETVAKQRGE
jgi:hypothetical protein